MSTVLVVSDIQLPFMHKDAIKFLKACHKKYKPDTVVQIGDLFDQYFANAWGKSTKAQSARQEYELALEILHKEMFPIFKGSDIKIVWGNHDERIFKRADESGIPEFAMKSIRELYQLPKEIESGYEFKIDGVTYIHGHTTKCGEGKAAEVLTYEYETPVVFGHFHSSAGINYLANKRRLVWAFNVGCLIDTHAYAFEYGRSFKNKPILGIGMVINGQPHYVPMILDAHHNWIGKLP